MKGDPGGMGTIRLAGGTIRLALTDAKKLFFSPPKMNA